MHSEEQTHLTAPENLLFRNQFQQQRRYSHSTVQQAASQFAVLQSMAETMRVVRQAMKCENKQLLKFDSDDFIDDAIYMDQQAQAELAGSTSVPSP